MNRGQTHGQRWRTVALCVTALLVSGCGVAHNAPAAKYEPSRVEPIEGSEVSRVILTDQAAKRLDIQTQAIRMDEVDGVQRWLVPYAAVIYDVEGEAWVYTNPAPLTFVRAGIDVDTVEGDMAILSTGPPAGTTVVTVGGAELYGAEFEFQEA